jgi:DNA-binding transcriptional LysR family regulator
MDLDLRKLRYFVAVADRLHFGRAAEELHIAQPVLSRQIRALEQDLGAPLLARDSHGVALTDAGRQLLTDAGPLLASAQAVRRRVTAAARGSRRLMVGFRAGIAVTPAVRQFAERHPDILVDVQRIEADEQASMLLDGRIDVGYVRLPIDEAGLRVTPLYTEPRVAVLPAGHRLAGKDQVTEADLAGEPLVWPGGPATQPCRVPKLRPWSLKCGFLGQPVVLHAAHSYSWISPPRTSRRCIRAAARSVTGAVAVSPASGGRRFLARCGRCRL